MVGGKIWEKTILNSKSRLYMIVDPPVLGNYIDDINYQKFDIAIIATPIDTHFQLAKMIIEHEKSVLIEKPGTHNSQDLQELSRLADKYMVCCGVGYELLYLDCLNMKSAIWLYERINTHLNRCD